MKSIGFPQLVPGWWAGAGGEGGVGGWRSVAGAGVGGDGGGSAPEERGSNPAPQELSEIYWFSSIGF